MDEPSPVLYVDDEPKNLYLFRRMFGRDYRVHTAESGAQALALVEQEALHLVISDQRMPGMTGVELLGTLYRDRPEIMRLLTTGYSDIEAVASAINQGHVYQYVRKPWRRSDFAAVIDEALGERQRVEARRLTLRRLRRRAEEIAAVRRRLEGAAGAPEQPEAVDVAGAPMFNLLCVDTESAVLDTFRAVFEPDYQVHTTVSGRQALELVAGRAIDLVIADQRTADLEGVGLLKALHSEHPRVLRLITGLLDYPTALEAINVGRVHGYVAKPWRLDELSSQIEDLAQQTDELFGDRLISTLEKQIESDLETVRALDPSAAEDLSRDDRIH